MSYRWVMIGSAIGGLLRCTITRWTLAIGLWGNALLNARAAVVTSRLLRAIGYSLPPGLYG